MTGATILAAAVAAYEAQQFQQAFLLCVRVLETDPRDIDALHFAGLSLCRLGEAERGIDLVRESLLLRDDNAEAHNNLGNMLWEVGNIGEAEFHFRQATYLLPSATAPHANLGKLLLSQGRLEEALIPLRTAHQLAPEDDELATRLAWLYLELQQPGQAEVLLRRLVPRNPTPELYNNLANALACLGRTAEALRCYQSALALAPTQITIAVNLARALTNAGRSAEARAVLERVLVDHPDCVKARLAMAGLALDQGDIAAARQHLQTARIAEPENPEVLAGWGRLHLVTQKYAEAARALADAAQGSPEDASLWADLGGALGEIGEVEKAITALQKAIELKPDLHSAYNNLGMVHLLVGDGDSAAEAFSTALRIRPDLAQAHSNALMAAQYATNVDAAALLRLHRAWDVAHGSAYRLLWSAPPPSPQPPVPLRVGFVSPDFGRHPVGYFVLGLFEALDDSGIETVCYSDRLLVDDVTERFRGLANEWRDVCGFPDHQLDALIRQDGIHVLVDLTGHMAKNRMRLFARKPAPVQVSWAGYVGTTGLEAMDVLLADCHHLPPDTEVTTSEKVIRLPDAFVTFSPPDYAPPVGPLPARTNKHITFGCFNNPAKINARTLELWRQILISVPSARLRLRYVGMDAAANRDRILRGLGEVADRVSIEPGVPHADHLKGYNEIDVALDTFPYSGSTTTLEAMWMGVPVITRTGNTFPGRHSTCFLRQAGLDDWVCPSDAEYVARAVAAAQDLEGLERQRAELRDRFARSPLCDSSKFATAFVAACREAWEVVARCQSGPVMVPPRPAQPVTADKAEPLSITFIDPVAWGYGPSTPMQQPLGGTQSCAAYLTSALARRGHRVTLLNGQEAMLQDSGVTVAQLDQAKLSSLAGQDAIVLMSEPHPEIVARLPQGPVRILWMHHAHDQSLVRPLVQQRLDWDKVVCISDWQRELVGRSFKIPQERLALIPNAAGPAFIETTLEQEKPWPPLLVYSSTPYRGLEILLDVFPKIRAAVPGTRLRIHSGMDVYRQGGEADPYTALYARAAAIEGVEMVGNVSQHALAASFAEATLLAYPNIFAETFCITALEAMAAGCLVVSSRLGALPQTTADYGFLLPVPPATVDHAADFAAVMIAVLRWVEHAPDQVRVWRATQHEHARSQSWEDRAIRWESLIASIRNR